MFRLEATHRGIYIFAMLHAPLRVTKDHSRMYSLNIANGSYRKVFWYGVELPVWNMEKLSSIPFYTMRCPLVASSDPLSSG